MGGHSSKSTTIQNSDIYSKQNNMQDQTTNIHNAHGQHNIKVGAVGDGSTIYLLNLQQAPSGSMIQAQTIGQAQLMLV